MADTDGSSRSPRWRIAVAIVLGVLCIPVLLGPASLVAEPDRAFLALVGVCGLATALLWRRSGTDGRSDESEAADGSTVWNAIPSRQYDGRHAEAGGITRGEQERALRDIQQQADELAAERRE